MLEWPSHEHTGYNVLAVKALANRDEAPAENRLISGQTVAIPLANQPPPAAGGQRKNSRRGGACAWPAAGWLVTPGAGAECGENRPVLAVPSDGKAHQTCRPPLSYAAQTESGSISDVAVAVRSRPACNATGARHSIRKGRSFAPSYRAEHIWPASTGRRGQGD